MPCTKVSAGLLASIVSLASAQFSTSSFSNCLFSALDGDRTAYFLPSDPFYGFANHGYNLDHPYSPAAIVYPKTAEQTGAAVTCARQNGIPVQARSGGHSYGNYCLGGANGFLVVDTSNLDEFTYDSDAQTATFGSGTKLGSLTEKLSLVGRSMAYGVASDVGSGGHLTIGGLGPLGRQYGTGSDQIQSMQCVLANGSVVTASQDSNPDLYWAMRGCGSSFSIVTEFTALTHPNPGTAVQYTFNFTSGDVDQLIAGFKLWQDLISQPDLSRKFASTLTLANTTMTYSGTFYGDEASFNELNLFGNISTLDVNVVSHVATVAVADFYDDVIYGLGGGVPNHFYAKSLKITNTTLMTDDGITQMMEYLANTDPGSPAWFIIWDLDGGAISDIAPTDTAYWNRDALYWMQSYIINLSGNSTEQNHEFLTGLSEIVTQYTPGVDDSAYPGYVDPELTNPQQAYWGGNVARLGSIKDEYDPDNVFHNPQSIQPTTDTD